MAAPRPGKVLGDDGLLADGTGGVSSSRTYLGITLLVALVWYVTAVWGPFSLPLYFWKPNLPQPSMPREIDLTFFGGVIMIFALGAYGKDALMFVMPHVSNILQRLGSRTTGSLAQAPVAARKVDPAVVNVDRSGQEQQP